MLSIKEARELYKELRNANEVYRRGELTSLTDDEYDQKLQQLKKYVEKNPSDYWMLDSLEQTTTINYEGFEAYHTGMDDTFSLEETKEKIHEFNKGFVLASPKYDGATVLAYYKNGEFVKAFTGGRGGKPVDVTETFRLNVGGDWMFLQPIKQFEYACVKGEVCMSYDDAEKYGYAAPRNAAAGVIQATTNPKQGVKLRFKAFNMEVKDMHFNTRLDVYEFIDKLPDYVEQKIVNEDELEEYYNKLNKEKIDKDVIPLDGIVVASNTDTSYDGLFAWKFQYESYTSKVLDIKAQVGRTGKITPVLKIEPVRVETGATVSSITANNYWFLKNIGKGSKVTFTLGGGVIPKVLSYGISSDPMGAPTECPSCFGRVITFNTEHFCENAYDYNFHLCKEALANRIVYFCKILGIEGVAYTVARKIVDEIGVDSIKGFVLNSQMFKIVLGVNGEKIHESILSKIGKIDEVKLLTAVSIKRLGTETLDRLSEVVDMKEMLFDDYGREETLSIMVEKVEGFGRATADYIIDFTNNGRMLDELRALFNYFKPVKKQVLEKVEDSPIEGMSIVQTGNFEHDGRTYTREEFKELVKRYGGKFKTTISRKTDYLVVGKAAGKSKISKAKEYNVQTISNDEFADLLGL